MRSMPRASGPRSGASWALQKPFGWEWCDGPNACPVSRGATSAGDLFSPGRRLPGAVDGRAGVDEQHRKRIHARDVFAHQPGKVLAQERPGLAAVEIAQGTDLIAPLEERLVFLVMASAQCPAGGLHQSNLVVKMA